ncbi:MAG TPA: Rieske (2Fe-2S) protein [Desulfuromonadales bacterium]|nr:Rieske (2Fe-2S) protein [Desulfuromonadales bacterium]
MRRPLTRRQWLGKGLAGLVLFGFGGLLLDVWLSARRFTSARWTPLVDLQSLPGDGVFPIPQRKVALLVEQGRMAVISLECTHLGCLVNVEDDGFFCPCHGSDFGPRGQVYSGPATRPLPWHQLRIQSSRVWFYSGQKITSPQWLPVPMSQAKSPEAQA